MRLLLRIVPAICVTVCLVAGAPVAAQGQAPRKRLLVIGEEKGYRHEAVTHAMVTIERLGKETGLWDTVIRTDTEALTKKKLEYNAKNLNDFDAVVFYTGGTLENPTYEDVCSHTTGHAEVVEVEYDPTQISFAALLDVFWSSHDPTMRHRQGPDIGSQYRSAIFFTTPEQEATARMSAVELEKSGKVSGPITTEITFATPFYAAEEYHQKYYAKHGGGSCRIP